MMTTLYAFVLSSAAEGRDWAQEAAAVASLKGLPVELKPYHPPSDFRRGYPPRPHVYLATVFGTGGPEDDDLLFSVARLPWCNYVVIKGSGVTPLGLLRLVPMRNLRRLDAEGDQFDEVTINSFRTNRSDVHVNCKPTPRTRDGRPTPRV
jgi:hypothetical protein